MPAGLLSIFILCAKNGSYKHVSKISPLAPSWSNLSQYRIPLHPKLAPLKLMKMWVLCAKTPFELSTLPLEWKRRFGMVIHMKNRKHWNIFLHCTVCCSFLKFCCALFQIHWFCKFHIKNQFHIPSRKICLESAY